jgi:hypothetical protein
MCPHTILYVSSYYMCPHTPMYVSLYYHICVLNNTLYVSSYYYVCVRMQVVAHHIAMWDPAAADGKGRWSGIKRGKEREKK